MFSMMDEEQVEKNPKLILAQWKFLLSSRDYPNKADISKKLLKEIKAENMAPFYEDCCKSLKWETDAALLKSMKQANEKKLKELDAAIADAEANLGEMEVRDANLKKAEYLCRIGAKDEALTAFREAYEKSIALGRRLDVVFHIIRIGFFYMDHELITRNLQKARELMEEGGDWDRRNRLKVYHGMYEMVIRNFKEAATAFLDTITTFTSSELMDYADFVKYTVYVCMISLPRNELRDKIVRGPEIQEALNQQIKEVKDYLHSLYESHYADFFKNLARVETDFKFNYFLYMHYRYYVREMRILAYSQLLESYKSLTLQSMAKTFGVTVDFIDNELARFISLGRLNCKIDKVNGIVETNRPDTRNWQYQSTIKHGDILLNRIQKLSRVINI